MLGCSARDAWRYATMCYTAVDGERTGDRRPESAATGHSLVASCPLAALALALAHIVSALWRLYV
jgi:hypothetical protein